ncbi:hypothetical protein [Caulobacter mirabilis]|uniref:Uncharacterized protein n=1 Tax=Caulobacter mirabilis TaxID=69666 RepID=A0A2D2ATP1_9CAUL|nr:hypothetical protein [Caulobacter mirabilis]ATQ41337.1 hypothetical protein CSW64_02365 [Caulobacter mirabilis]
MKRKIVAHQVADQLFAAEAAIDGALAAVATLTAMLPNARIDAHISAVIGQNAIDRTSQTIAALAEARRGIVETHRELSDVQHQIGLGAVALGGLDKPAEDTPRLPVQGAARHIRAA